MATQMRLTEDMIQKINQAVDEVVSSGFGEVTIKIEKGTPRYVVKSWSVPLAPEPRPAPRERT